jgi:predicted DNA binding protein
MAPAAASVTVAPRSASSVRSARGEEPPSRGSAGPRGPVNICRLRVPLPDSAWVAQFSRENPEVEIEVVSRLDVGHHRSVSEVLLHVAEAGSWAGALRALEGVDDVEQLESDATVIHLRVVHRTSEFVPIFRELRLMRRFPFVIRGGEASWVVVASESKIRALLARIRERAPEAVLESVRHTATEGRTGPLTPRQTELFRRAMAAGYFDVPRKITLTDLAAQLEMAISSVSEALAVIEKKLLERTTAAG